jgi:hypothetical protein
MKICPICEKQIAVSDLECLYCNSQLKHCPQCGQCLMNTAPKCIKCGFDFIKDAKVDNHVKKRNEAMSKLVSAGAKANPQTSLAHQPRNQLARTSTPDTAAPVTSVLYENKHPKSLTFKAIVTLILYYVGFWILGFVANLIFLGEANREKERTGQSPSGSGCLSILFFFHVQLPLFILGITICLAIVLGIFASDLLLEILNTL